MKITILGTVAQVGEEKSFGSLRKREILLNEGGDPSRPLPVEFSEGVRGPARLLALLALEPGALVRVEAVLGSRPWNGRHYLQLVGIKVETASFSDPAKALPPQSENAPASAAATDSAMNELPF